MFGGILIGVTMNDPMQHYVAHPYYLMGVAAERNDLLDRLKNNTDWNNIQDVIDDLEAGK